MKDPCTANACFCYFTPKGKPTPCSPKEVSAMKRYVEWAQKFYRKLK